MRLGLSKLVLICVVTQLDENCVSELEPHLSKICPAEGATRHIASHVGHFFNSDRAVFKRGKKTTLTFACLPEGLRDSTVVTATKQTSFD